MPGRGRDTTFDVSITIDGSKLRGNYMNSGSEGANPAAHAERVRRVPHARLGSDKLKIPWHVLPRKAAKVAPSTSTLVPGSFPQVIGLNNQGVGTAQNDAYALLATSPNIPEGRRVARLRLRTSVRWGSTRSRCGPALLGECVVHLGVRDQHVGAAAAPAARLAPGDPGHEPGRDGRLRRAEPGQSGTQDDHGRSAARVGGQPEDEAASAFFYAEHSMNTGNTVLYICAEQIGMSGADLLANTVDMEVVRPGLLLRRPG